MTDLTEPKRIQRERTKGWKMPEGAVYVGRPTVFGNPFKAYKCECCGYWDVKDENDVTYLVDHQYVRQPHVRADRSTWTTKQQALRETLRLYNDELTYWVGGRLSWDPEFREKVESLRGRDLACWCPLDQPCHADVLLALVNAPAEDETTETEGGHMTSPEFGTEDYRRWAVLFNDITHAPTEGHILFSNRRALCDYLWEQGWRREVRAEDITERPKLDLSRQHYGICPKCREDKFIGHGPLCIDCYLAPTHHDEENPK